MSRVQQLEELGPGPAEAAAARAASDAAVTVEVARSSDDLRQAKALIDGVWPGPTMVPMNLMRALLHGGSYIAVARRAGGAIAGTSVGLLALDGHHPYLHSHITCTAVGGAGRGVGFAMKLHQRSWALAAGFDAITWTFDPLVRRNAHFNLTKLGADAHAYLPDFYGAMEDAVNAGDRSDRLLMRWCLDSPRAVAAAAGVPQPVPDDEAAAAVDALSVGLDGGPVIGSWGRRTPIACAVPSDTVLVRGTEPAMASAWRTALRAVLHPSLESGWTVRGMTTDGRYVLSPPG